MNSGRMKKIKLPTQLINEILKLLVTCSGILCQHKFNRIKKND